MEVGIGWPRALFEIFEFEHLCSFAKILAHKHSHSQSNSIENTDRRGLKGKFSNKKARGSKKHLWRGSLLPLDGEAIPSRLALFFRLTASGWFCDGCAVEREQAPSPR
jgi:hypothetical protein